MRMVNIFYNSFISNRYVDGRVFLNHSHHYNMYILCKGKRIECSIMSQCSIIGNYFADY
jgi:hypothetical protein